MSPVREHRYTTSTGLTLVGDEGGPAAAPTVVLLHGGGQTRHSWGGAMRELIGEGYRVINFDARGHGDSDWATDGDYSFEARALDLQAVMVTVSGPAALVGASMGGITAFHALGSGSVSAKALVLVDVVLRPNPVGAARIISFMQANQDGFANLEEAADAVAAYNPNRPRPRDSTGLLKNLRRRADGRLHWHWDPRMLDRRPLPEPPEWVDKLVQLSGGVTVPTLLVRGAQSDIVDAEGVAELRSLVPQTEVAEVGGAGHMIAGDRNDAFNAAVTGFLRRNLPPAAARPL